MITDTLMMSHNDSVLVVLVLSTETTIFSLHEILERCEWIRWWWCKCYVLCARMNAQKRSKPLSSNEIMRSTDYYFCRLQFFEWQSNVLRSTCITNATTITTTATICSYNMITECDDIYRVFLTQFLPADRLLSSPE